ncbi:MAG: GMC family oxidoreductase, partial [Candidatus Rokuibacteriota bacterium]
EYARRAARGQDPWRTPIAEMDRYTASGNFPFRLEAKRARGIGGSTLHWEGYTLRFHANDFRLRSLYGIAEDWPISYEDLEPHYAKAEAALGIAGAADDPWGSPRSTAYPLPPFAFSYSDQLFAKACQELDIALHHLPQARNSVAYAGRSRCLACAVCHACPTGAKASVDLTHVARAEATGRARVLADTTALRLEVDRSKRVSGIVYAGHDRRERRLAPRIVVVAANGVETARLLLLSASPAFPTGLANTSGEVGKHFMSHPAIDVVGRVRTNVFPHRVGFSTAISRQFAVERERATRGSFFLEFLNNAGPPPEWLAASSGKWGEPLRRHVQQEFGRLMGVRVYCEQLPDPANSVSLDPGTRDYFGNPVPHLAYGLGRYEQNTLREAERVATRILQSLGAEDIRAQNPEVGAHQLGTHRMGRDPSRSVVDADLRAHDVPNLYLVGGGCFVTGSSAYPTLTVAALAIRAAEHITSLVRRGAGALPRAQADGEPARHAGP